MNDTKEQLSEPITPKTMIIVDGVMSIERAQALIALQLEEERLDYKEKFDISSDASRKKAKIDIVCDLVAMSNTDGGYIIVGVRQEKNGSFAVEGIENDCITFLAQENIQNWVDSYVDKSLRILSRAINYDKENTIVLIFIHKSLLPALFKKNGQYHNTKKKRSVSKFAEADIFVRHGSKSERAKYDDLLRFDSAIRADEREKLISDQNRHKDIVDHLDTIITLLGGAATQRRWLDLSNTKREEVEDQTINILSTENPVIIRRSIKREFQSIRKFLTDQQNINNRETITESMDRTFVDFLSKMLPVWAISIEYKSNDMVSDIAEHLYRLYLDIHSLNFKVQLPGSTILWLQSKIVISVYIWGAFSVMRDDPLSARLLVYRGNAFDNFWRDKSWFIYVLTMLARTKQLTRKGLCAEAYESSKTDNYVISLFENEDLLLTYICQFDFLQCAITLARTKDIGDIYPSFGIYSKHRITPLLEKLIRHRQEGNWMDTLPEKDLAVVIDKLDKIATKEFEFYFNWEYGSWDSRLVTNFITENMKNVSS